MIRKKKETAEEKLLKLMEASKKGQGGAPAPAPKKKFSLIFSTNAFIALINRLLLVLIVVMILVTLNEVRVGMALLQGADQVDDSIRKTKNSSVSETVMLPNIQDLAFYLSNVRERSLFHPYVPKENAPSNLNDKNKTIAGKTSHLKLVGVSWLDRVDTASVMIEDTEKSVTYFLQKGEKIGDIFVKTIYADSVELGYQNEEIIIQYDKSQM